MCLLLKSGFHLATQPYRPGWWRAAEVIVLLEVSPLSTQQCWSFVRVASGYWSRPWLRLFYPWSLRLAGQSTLGRVLVVPNVLHLKMMEATVVIGTCSVAKDFLYLSVDICLYTILSWKSAIPWNFWLGLLCNMTCNYGALCRFIWTSDRWSVINMMHLSPVLGIMTKVVNT